MFIFGITIFAAIFHVVVSHSAMTYPESMSSRACRMGGQPDPNCPGPCDLTMFTGERANDPWANYFPPSKPFPEAFQRGQNVQIKYTRNNHGPGGFVALTLVTVQDMMSKAVHKRNTFHYSCWGANPKVASPAETETKPFGYSMVGSDGEQHSLPKGYYVVDVKIPTVVPDGNYILGWVWFGGTSGDIETNSPQVPDKYSFFSDYYSCSFITIKGGVSLASSYTPVFNNDQAFDKTAEGAEGWENGCMAQNDAPGICAVESCDGIKGFYQKPAAFKNGSPRPLTPADFGGVNSAPEAGSSDPTPTPSPKAETVVSASETAPSPTPSSNGSFSTTKSGEIDWKGRASCVCLIYDDKCHSSTAKWSESCMANTAGIFQPTACKNSCCNMCKSENSFFCSLMKTTCTV